MNVVRPRILLGGALVLLVAASFHGQSPSQGSDTLPTFRSKVRLVLVDVVVANSKGEPVGGLQKEDFQVSENGKSQKVVFFEEHKGTAKVRAELPSMPPDVFTNYPTIKPADSVNVLLLDWLNTQPQDQAFVRAQVLKYLKQVPPGTRMAVFALGTRLQMVQGFTTDLSLLSSVLQDSKSAKTRFSPLLPTAVGQAADQELIALMEMNRAAPAAIEAARQEMSANSASDTGLRMAITLEAFQELERYLSPIPGRKNIIWLAGSFPITVFPEGDTPRTFEPEIRQTADMLTPSKIAIYPISAEGLTGDATYSAEYEQGPSVRDENQRRAANQASMEEIANDTGGHAFYNTNGLGTAIARIVDEGQRYYTLAYTPSNKKMDGSYRRIQVKLANGDYKAAYRRGYYAEEAKAPRDENRTLSGDPLLRLTSYGLPDIAQILYKIRVDRVQRDPEARLAGSNAQLKEPLERYSVDFAISPDDLKFENAAGGTHRAQVEVMVVAYDRAGRPLNLTAGQSQMSFPNKEFADLHRIGIQFHRDIDVPAGEVYLRTGVYDWTSGKAGTLGLSLPPPAPVSK